MHNVHEYTTVLCGSQVSRDCFCATLVKETHGKVEPLTVELASVILPSISMDKTHWLSGIYSCVARWRIAVYIYWCMLLYAYNSQVTTERKETEFSIFAALYMGTYICYIHRNALFPTNFAWERIFMHEIALRNILSAELLYLSSSILLKRFWSSLISI